MIYAPRFQIQWFHILKSKLNYIPLKAKYEFILIVDTLVTGGNGKWGILTRSKACVINADYILICHRHKCTAVPGLTFLFVTSKHTVHPPGHGTSLISLHLFPTLHQIPHWVWMLSISTHTGCLNHWHKLLFSQEDLDVSADSAAGSVVADGLKYCLLPSCHCAAAAGICDTAFVRGHQSSSCLLSLILMAAEPRSTTQN